MKRGPIGRIRAKLRASQYVLTAHAWDEMLSDGLTEDDVEASISSGRIVRIQADHLGRRKYTIERRTRDGRRLTMVCRYSDLGDRVVVITVYEMSEE